MSAPVVEMIPLARIVPNPDQPRKEFCPTKHGDLAASIRERGLMQPITVRPIKGGMMEIVAGERRWRAMSYLHEKDGKAKFAKISAIVRKMTTEERDIAAIIENLQRADISPFEEADAYQRMLDAGWKPEALAKALGIQQVWRITYRTALHKLSPEAKAIVKSGGLSYNAAYELTKVSAADQSRILRRVNSGALKGDAQIQAAVMTLLDTAAQTTFLDDTGPSEEQVATVAGMEAIIDRLTALVAKGWKDGECVIAAKVAPDRMATATEKLKLIKTTITAMEKQLTQALASRAVLV